MPEIAKNSFQKGRSSDVDPAVVSNDTYLEAHNVTLTGDDKFLAIENIKGTLLVGADLASGSSAKHIGLFTHTYLINSVATQCLTIFTARSNFFDIYCYDPATDTSYRLFRQTYTGYESLNPVVDGYTYPEQGVDIFYFTDGINEMRKLRCEFNTPLVEFTENDLSLQRLQPNGKVTLSSVADGGTLLCGTYVVSHRLVNPTTNVYSKWSPFTAPIHINQSDLSGSEPFQSNGTYNSNSSQKIQLSTSVTAAENAIYTHYQIGVVQRTAATTALTLDLQPLQDLTGAISYNYTYRENTKIDSIDLSDVVIDDAAIESVKTLVIKNNKLFGANVNYTNLEFDNGTPEIISGSILTQDNATSNELFANPDSASKYKGYFRDEVYRFGIVYFDKYGNYSKVQVLDTSNVTGNESTQTSFKDMKFPSRRNPNYHVFNSSNRIQSIGLRVEVDNHPSWAKGFVIVRAGRKKNIVTQTPFVDCSELDGIEVIGEYPSIAHLSGNATEQTYEGVTPMNPLGTLAPKNLLWLQRRHSVKSTIDSNPKQSGEVYWGTDNEVSSFGQVGSPNNYTCIFPQNDIYEGGGFENKEYNWETVDYAFLRMKKSSITPGSYDDGDTKDTEVHATFYADKAGDYFCSDLDPSTGNQFDPSLYTYTRAQGTISEYKLIDNSSPGTTIGSYFFQNYNNLITQGFTNYIAPNSQRMGVIKTNEPRSSDVADFAANGSVGTLIAPSGDEIPAGFFNGTISKFSYESASYDESTQYANVVEIANITNGLTDDRYGDINDLHEFISTGAVYNLLSAEVSGNTPVTIDIWGGDCFVSMHSFKLTDSYFGVSNNNKYATGTSESEIDILNKWGISFDAKYSGNVPISLPVPFKTCSTVLSVVLESEYNGVTTSKSPLGYSTTSNSFSIPYSSQKGTWKIPFAYGYNINYNTSNTEKIFLPPYDGQLNVESLKSRIVYSDQKVYQTGVTGFDRIRVSNTLDLDETYGGITKLALAGEDMISVQERATSYLPVDKAQTETTDGVTLSIRSSEIIGIPDYISRRYGSQHLRSVFQADRTIFFVDNLNQLAARISDRSLDLISEKGAVKQFNSWLRSTVDPDNIVVSYDFVKKQAWFLGNGKCEIWDDRLGCWVGDYQLPTMSPPPSAINVNYSGNNHLIVLGTLSGGNLKAYAMYEGDYNSLFDITVTPSVKFSVNDKFEVVKTFDNLIVYSSDKLDTINIVAEKEPGVVGNEVSGIDIDKDRREGNYRVQVPYDVDRARIRGTRAYVTVNWNTTNLKTVLSSVVTKYRVSKMII